MCIAVFMWKSHPRYPFLLLINRDEYHNRETAPLHWWEDGVILGGKDERSGGTWLACSKYGKIAFLTNVREIPSNPQLKTRGDLPIRFLKSEKTPKDFSEELADEAEQYNGFNLIIADFHSMTMFYVTNRPKDKGLSTTEVSPGIHLLSNAQLDTPWPKALRLRHSFEDAIKQHHRESDFSLKEITEKLMNDTTKDDENELPRIYPPQFERLLSSIFVEADTPLGRYGTRSSSAIALRSSGEVEFYDRSLQNDQQWNEESVIFRIIQRVLS